MSEICALMIRLQLQLKGEPGLLCSLDHRSQTVTTEGLNALHQSLRILQNVSTDAGDTRTSGGN
jgi:hypothetical protein